MTAVYFGIFLVSVLVSFVLTRYVRNVAMARGWVAVPASDRHMHTRPLPRLGGVAIFFTFSLSIGLASLLSWLRPSLIVFQPRQIESILIPGVLIFLLGVYDDLRGVNAYVKFAVQAIAGCILYAFGLQIFDLPVLFGTHHAFPWFVSLPLTVLWVLAITNAFNLIDGLDGLAAGSALFSTLVVFVVALLSQSSFMTISTLAMAGAILGFLRFNFNPATIFLGDCGSLFIGFMLSALALRGAQKAPTAVAVAIPVVSFGLPILETTLSVVRRFISGRPVFTADREHIHHKLLQLGFSHRQVVVLLYAVSGIFALLSLFLLWPTGSTLGLILAVLGTGIWVGVQHLGYLEFGELRRVAQRTMDQRLIFVNNLSIRRAMEELKVVHSYEQLCRVLVAAFQNNDFDAFDLTSELLPRECPKLDGMQVDASQATPCLRWVKPGTFFGRQEESVWRVTLSLVTSNNHNRGSMVVCRRYVNRDLQLDINLLTKDFPVVLAHALDRVLAPMLPVVSRPQEGRELSPAQAG
ncbi:MAG TPA: MraY family glycosyltransferase [Terriglobales bacterium]|nr:MraY family glycosyltransferase [Terriglobales bacterium]